MWAEIKHLWNYALVVDTSIGKTRVPGLASPSEPHHHQFGASTGQGAGHEASKVGVHRGEPLGPDLLGRRMQQRAHVHVQTYHRSPHYI